MVECNTASNQQMNNFEDIAKQHPDHECYIFRGENKRYTYSAFQHEIGYLTKSLFDLGFEKDDYLGVVLPNSSENVVLSYVAAKLGVIKVHIDPMAVAYELGQILSRMQCKGLVVNASDESFNTLRTVLSGSMDGADRPQFCPPHIILIGSNEQMKIGQGLHVHSYSDLIRDVGHPSLRHDELFVKLKTMVDPDTPHSMLFTSGSTGRSKMVVLTNFAVSNSARFLQQHFGTFSSRYCAALSMVHVSTGIRGILLPSAAKCTVVVPALRYDPEAIMIAIHEEKCTCMMSGPALFHAIFAHPGRTKYDMSSLECVTLSGTPVEAGLLQRIQRELGVHRAGQVYGMTESASLLTSSLYADMVDDRLHSSLGRCMPHMELKLVDDAGGAVPVGSQGEICARGYGIMKGYFDDDATTETTVIENGWLRTGDIAAMDKDGYIFFVGRKKEIIIGHIGNVYPMEIELAIALHPNVLEAHAFGIPEILTDSAVCAFVRLKPNTHCDANELERFLSGKLTAYKIPKHIRFVSSFPRTLHGKVPKYRLAEVLLDDLMLFQRMSEKL